MRNGHESCPNGKHHRAEEIEAEAWEMLSALLKDPERLQIGIERMIGEKRVALREDPIHALHYWHGELEKTGPMRNCYLDQQDEGIITMNSRASSLP